MCNRTLHSLLTGIVDVPSVLDVTIHGLQSDSRCVRNGDAFMALAGSKGDAWAYVSEAIKRGAVAVLLETQDDQGCDEREGVLLVKVPGLSRRLGLIADRFYEAPSADMHVLGVTGTNGKSSVTRYVEQLLNDLGVRTGQLGTLGYGFPDKLVPATHTTPDVVRVHRWLKEMKREGAGAVVMEVSSHALEQGRVDDVRFEGAIFTNLTRDHLDYHGSMDAYGAAKAKLFQREGLSFAAINFDDPFGRQLATQVADHCDVMRYSLHESSVELWLEKLHTTPSGFTARVGGRWGLMDIAAPLMGSFNVSNVLAAMTAVLAMGHAPDRVAASVSRLTPAPGRLQPFMRDDGVRVVVDYAHTPDALSNALAALRPHVDGRLWCIFGCGGDRDAGKRPEMAAVAEELADLVVVTDDNPRTESPQQIVSDILKGFRVPAEVTVEHQRARAIANVLEQAAAGDVVLVAGKGHEDYQEVGAERLPYSDIQTVSELLAAKRAAL